MASANDRDEQIGGKRKHSCFDEDSDNEGSTENDSTSPPFRSTCIIPRQTSAWNRFTLESLSIFYEAQASNLSELMSKIYDCFNELNTERLELLTVIKNIFTFDLGCDQVKAMPKVDFKLYAQTALWDMKKKIRIECSEVFGEQLKLLTEGRFIDFVDDTSSMIIDIKEDAVTDGSFTQFFCSFINMCQLSPKYGKSYKTTEEINGVHVVSCPDYRIKKRTQLNPAMNTRDCVESIVTIAKVKQHKIITSLAERNASRTSLGVVATPCICEYVNNSVLGEHGGQLLLEWKLSKFKSRYVPGMIVTGSKVVFTSLEISKGHVEKLRSNDELAEEHEASIYYTKAFDILKKADRDIVVETLLKLSM